MILEAIKYVRLIGKSKEWGIEGRDNNLVHFGNVNLIVGKNSAGKSRTLSIISDISDLFSQVHLSNAPHIGAKYNLVFKDGDDLYEYSIDYENKQVVEETLYINKELRLDRSRNLIYSDSTQQMETFQIDKQLISISLHGDEKYAYLDKLFLWGITLKISSFTNQIEKNFLLKDLSELDKPTNASQQRVNTLLYVFLEGKKLFGDTFIDKIKQDMYALNYSIETIDVLKGSSGYGLYVKEKELDDLISQLEMSQGMFRALAFIIQFNFALMSKMSVCILFDDLGEGLDFDRSKRLVDLLIDNVTNLVNIQIFITTNDRYIMNKIPLKYWSVIKRFPQRTKFYNYYNSKEIFDDFEYTGLSNFDFLATDFYLKGFDNAEE